MKLSDYVESRGKQSELARAISVQPQLMWQWARGVRPVPLERCIPIERATDGQVRCEDLRPDVDWAYLRGVDRQMATAPAPIEQPAPAAQGV